MAGSDSQLVLGPMLRHIGETDALQEIGMGLRFG